MAVVFRGMHIIVVAAESRQSGSCVPSSLASPSELSPVESSSVLPGDFASHCRVVDWTLTVLSVVDRWAVGVCDRGNSPGIVLIRPVAICTFVGVDDEVGLVVGGIITSGWIGDGLGIVVG